MARRVNSRINMRNAIMIGALALAGGVLGCHGVSPPNYSPTPNADLQGEAANAGSGLDPKTGSTVDSSASPSEKMHNLPVEKTTPAPADKPAPEPPAPPPKP